MGANVPAYSPPRAAGPVRFADGLWYHVTKEVGPVARTPRKMCVATIGLSALVACLGGCPSKPAPTGQETHPGIGLPAEGTDAPREEADVEWELTSAAFSENERMPAEYTGDGEDISPPLSWGAAPEGTEELVLICDDPDAPGGAWDHWVAYGIAPDVTELGEGVPTDGSVADPELKQGLNGWGETGYRGPAPPAGKPHRYQFALYAVGEATGLEPGASKDDVLAAIKGKVIARRMLQGIYSRR